MSYIPKNDIVVFIEGKGFVEGKADEVVKLKIRLYSRTTDSGREYRRIRVVYQGETIHMSCVYWGVGEYESARDLFLQLVSSGEPITPEELERLLSWE